MRAALTALILAAPAQAKRLTCTSEEVSLRIEAAAGACAINGRDALLARAARVTRTRATPRARRLTVPDALRAPLKAPRARPITRGTCGCKR